jgi:acetolactate synthase-1/2/3 large subunit
LAEHLGACVLTTMQGKSMFPENHPLYGWHTGHNGTVCGNPLAVNADVLLAVGVRFADKGAASYRPGIAYNIPPTRLIHVDIDPFEIGKNYPVEVGVVGDAKAVLAGLISAVRELTPPRAWQNAPYTQEIARRVADHCKTIERSREATSTPVTMGRAIAEVRKALPEDGIVFSSSGLSQGQIMQEMMFTRPRTYLSEGGNSCMGWAYPAAMGGKLAAPDAPVIALTGDGDFLMTIQEIATAVQYDLPVVAVVLNNQGWQSIRDLQRTAFGDEAAYVTMFEREGNLITPHLADVARAFGAHGVRVSQPGEIADAVDEALKAQKPGVVEVLIDTTLGTSGTGYGWWDVPVPHYFENKYRTYETARREERV